MALCIGVFLLFVSIFLEELWRVFIDAENSLTVLEEDALCRLDKYVSDKEERFIKKSGEVLLQDGVLLLMIKFQRQIIKSKKQEIISSLF